MVKKENKPHKIKKINTESSKSEAEAEFDENENLEESDESKELSIPSIPTSNSFQALSIDESGAAEKSEVSEKETEDILNDKDILEEGI